MALLEDAARQVYQEWFVRLRFPGAEHTRIVDGVPEGWERKTAFDAIQVLSGGTPKTTNPDYWDGEIPFYTPKDATDGIWVTDCERTVTELGVKNCNSKLYPKETVFISARGTVGKLNMAQRSMVMSQSCYALVGKDNLSQTFVYSAMQVAVESLRQQAVGAVFDAIIVDTFKRITLVVPDNKIIRLFDEKIRPMFTQVENLTIQNQKLRATRDLLLPKLMSGEISV
jgi:type I restriction enzyme S subunit